MSGFTSKIIQTKKINLGNSTFIGFKLNEIPNVKDLKIEFTLKGFSFINKMYLNKNSLQYLSNK